MSIKTHDILRRIIVCLLAWRIKDTFITWKSRTSKQHGMYPSNWHRLLILKASIEYILCIIKKGILSCISWVINHRWPRQISLQGKISNLIVSLIFTTNSLVIKIGYLYQTTRNRWEKPWMMLWSSWKHKNWHLPGWQSKNRYNKVAKKDSENADIFQQELNERLARINKCIYLLHRIKAHKTKDFRCDIQPMIVPASMRHFTKYANCLLRVIIETSVPLDWSDWQGTIPDVAVSVLFITRNYLEVHIDIGFRRTSMQENISLETARQDSVYGKTLIVPLLGLEKGENWQVIFSLLYAKVS